MGLSCSEMFLPSVFALFLEESSIHGVKYLHRSRSVVVRAVWLLCILASGTLAGVVIYYNVAAWDSSPAVITSVEPALVKDMDLMPMVTVCPRTLSYTNMLVSLLEWHPDLARQEDLDLMKHVIAEMAIIHRQAQWIPKSKAMVNEAVAIFDGCHNATSAEKSEGCQLAHLLYRIQNTRGLFRDYNDRRLRRYLVQSQVTGEGPTLDGLEAFVVAESKQVDALDEFPSSGVTSAWWKVLLLYTMLFPLYSDRDDDHLLELKGIDQYEPPDVPDLTKGDYAVLLGYLVDWQVTGLYGNSPVSHHAGLLDDLNVAVSSAFVSVLTGYFGQDRRDINLVSEVLNGFAGEYLPQPILVTVDPREHPCGNNSAGLSLAELCSNNMTTHCQKYCNLVQDKKSQEMARRLLEAGMHKAGPISHNLTRSFLPACSRSGGLNSPDCWMRVVNEAGICYTALSEARDQVVDGIGEEYSFAFAMDMRGTIDDIGIDNRFLYWYTPYAPSPSVDITVTPTDHFTIGQHTEEGDVRHLYEYQSSRFAEDVSLEVNVEYLTDATDQFKAMTPQSRGCLYSDEGSLEVYPSYSQSNCVLECAFRVAGAKCACVPWFLASHFPDSVMTCEAYGNLCFADVVGMRNEEKWPCLGHCLPDCRLVHYTTYEQPMRQLASRPVEDQPFDEIVTNKSLSADRYPNVKRILEIFGGRPSDETVGIIKVHMGKKSTLRFVRTATVTLVDIISNIGGTLGLFCGFSILSAVEVVYWAGSLLFKRKL